MLEREADWVVKRKTPARVCNKRQKYNNGIMTHSMERKISNFLCSLSSLVSHFALTPLAFPRYVYTYLALRITCKPSMLRVGVNVLEL